MPRRANPDSGPLRRGVTGHNPVKVGCCGFPLSLVRYSELFPVVEVQQTFYQPPLPRTLEKWRSQVAPGFAFTLKAWQLITHESTSPTYRRLREKLNEQQKRETGCFRLNATVLGAWERTLECARRLGSRLVLFQCPARFAPSDENKANLRAFFGEIRRREASPGNGGLTFAWEPRGNWRPEEIAELCEELGLVHAVDPFQRAPVTEGLGYFRLHGRSGYRYRFSESDFCELLPHVKSRAPCYVLFNNISMLEDAKRFLKLASQG